MIGRIPYIFTEPTYATIANDSPYSRGVGRPLMKKFLPLLSALLLLGTPAAAQMALVLDDFTAGAQPREGAAMGTWAGQVTQNATTISVGGTANAGLGWGVFNLVPTFSAAGMQNISIKGQLDAGNVADTLVITFYDTNLGSQPFTLNATLFTTGTISKVDIPIGAWVTADPTQLNGWTISAANPNPALVAMTFDQIALTSSIPEPGTYAALAGVLALGFAVWRRRK